MSTKSVLNALLRDELRFFTRRVFATVSPGDIYLDNWHIEALAHQLTRIARRDIKRLVVTMPPRHMKSISASVAFPAWLLGRDPSARMACISYSQDLATKFSLDTRLVMQSGWYQDCFPGTILSESKNTQSEFMTTAQGFRLATSVGGVLTGMGGDYLIIDDPHKPDDAQSALKRQQVIEWYKHTAATRLNNPANGCIIVVQQRLHQEDLAGTLLETGGWTHLNLPAIAEQHESIEIGAGKFHERAPGDPLHPERMSKADLEAKRSEIGSQYFASQYQQRPAPADGGIVKLEWFKYFDIPLPHKLGGRIIQSWDLAYTAADQSSFTVCMTALYQDHRFYLVNILRQKMEVPELLKLIPVHAAKYKAEIVMLESAGVGGIIIQQLRKAQLVSGQDWINYMPHNPKDDKATRLMKVAPLIESGRVYLPKVSRPWIEAFRQELQYFPAGKYDDQVDSFSQALTWVLCHTPLPPTGMFAGPSADAA